MSIFKKIRIGFSLTVVSVLFLLFSGVSKGYGSSISLLVKGTAVNAATGTTNPADYFVADLVDEDGNDGLSEKGHKNIFKFRKNSFDAGIIQYKQCFIRFITPRFLGRSFDHFVLLTTMERLSMTGVFRL